MLAYVRLAFCNTHINAVDEIALAISILGVG